ncbi:hypothetical protein [Desulfosarcina variabilis]|uniref:hypothetical protein n=1 Tax=Desulfosarcina variabilis TaxID=2300 RepID=UPI003AFA6041
MFKIWLAVLFVLFSMGTSSAQMSVQEWEDLFISRTAAVYELNETRSLSCDSWRQYFLSYGIDAHIAMFRATGNLEYLDRALFYINNLIDTAVVSSSLSRSQYKDSYLGWANHSHRELGDDGREYPLFESICWRYVAHLLRVMKETPDVYNDADYKDQYDRILSFLEKHIYEKWYTRGVANLYRCRTHMAAHWAYISLELWHITENSIFKPVYKEIFENINSGGLPNFKGASLRSQLITEEEGNTHYFWSSVWNSTQRPGQDTSHGNHVMAYIVEAHDLGVEWTDQDIDCFINTFNDIIWSDSEQLAEYVDGSGDGNNFISDGFFKLARYDKRLQERLETAYTPLHKGLQIYGNGALNAKIIQETGAADLDIEPDGDVDGIDLADFAAHFDSGCLAEFASAYGSEP